MDLTLTEEQRILFDSVSRMAEGIAALDPAQRHRQMVDFGLTALGLDPDEPMIAEGLLAAEALGQSRLADAWVFTQLGAARAIAGDPRFAALADAIAGGSATLAPALHEPGRRHDPLPGLTRLEGGCLYGHKAGAIGADAATHLLVTARDPAGQLVLAVVEAGAHGVARRSFGALDGRGGAEVIFHAVPLGAAAILATGARAEQMLTDLCERISAGLVAHSVGAMTSLMQMTATHLQTRKQFGRPIGAFQVLQHRFVDMKLAHELARSMAIASARALDSLQGEARSHVIATARIQAAASGRKIGEEAIQMHGAMGMTAEYPAGFFLKRLIVNAASYGDADHHLDRLIALADRDGSAAA